MQGDFRIGDRLIQPKINSVQHNGDTIHLEPKVMQVLLVLASNPGEVFTREEIREVVWRDVFVGDDALMRAVSEIRRVFNDDPRTPHTVQTVPKVGYRLIAPVGEMPISPTTASHEDSGKLTATGVAPSFMTNEAVPNPSRELSPRSAGRRPRWPLWIGVGATSVLLLIAIFRGLQLKSHPASQVITSYTSHPLTTYPGSQVQPTLSPEGDAVAFIWSKNAQEGNHLYVKSLKSGAPVRVTSGSDEDSSPAWSPDGRSLAFIRHSDLQSTIEVVAVVGGSERQVYTLPVNSVWQYGGLTWSTDGNSLIFPEQTTPGAASRLVELSLGTHAVRFLTTPLPNWNGDSMPAVSPDGTTLAFARGAEQSTRDIFVMKLPDGPARPLTSDAHLILGLTWTSDGSSIVFSSNRGGSPGLWRVPANGGAPERDLAGTDGAYWPTIARHGGFLAYTHGSASWTIASIPLDSIKPQPETYVLSSSEQDASPQVSPTGDRLAFQSWRSGMQEIWISAIDGSNPIQLTNQGASAGSPAWSRDARAIAFDARPNGFPHIYITDAEGASPRAITNGKFSDIVPSWSNDDLWIYFGSNRSGTWQIWREASDGQGSPQQVTSEGGMVAKESLDGKWIYFTQFATPGLWIRAVGGGPGRKIYDGPPLGDENYWTVSGNDAYVLSAGGGGHTLVRVDPEGGRAIPIYTLKHDPTPFAGLAVTPDSKHLLFAELMTAESNITLVEHYK